jgi:N,N'-diacetyllegionaminate synthase
MQKSKVFIIAEAGVNHNGSLILAKKLIDVAVAAKADAVKFQTFNSIKLASNNAQQADYQVINSGKKQNQVDMLKQLELLPEHHQILIDYCKTQNIEFMSTPFDDDSINLLKELGMQRWKIPSGELLSIPYLRTIGQFNKKTLLSTGMANLDEVTIAVNTLLDAGLETQNLTILHANSAYPTPYKDVNLNVMQTLASKFNIDVGLSDHTLGIEVPIAAVAMGASVIEKHITLDKNSLGPDQIISLEANELKQMVLSIRNIEQALGDFEKKITVSESNTLNIARKRIVASCEIRIGDIFGVDNLTLKRNNKGKFAVNWDNVIGKTSTKNYLEGQAIE